jgi:hypothetical protein
VRTPREPARVNAAVREVAAPANLLGDYTRIGSEVASMTITQDRITVTGNHPAAYTIKFTAADHDRIMINIFAPDDLDTLKGFLMVTTSDEGISISGPTNDVAGMWKRD